MKTTSINFLSALFVIIWMLSVYACYRRFRIWSRKDDSISFYIVFLSLGSFIQVSLTVAWFAIHTRTLWIIPDAISKALLVIWLTCAGILNFLAVLSVLEVCRQLKECVVGWSIIKRQTSSTKQMGLLALIVFLVSFPVVFQGNAAEYYKPFNHLVYIITWWFWLETAPHFVAIFAVLKVCYDLKNSKTDYFIRQKPYKVVALYISYFLTSTPWLCLNLAECLKMGVVSNDIYFVCFYTRTFVLPITNLLLSATRKRYSHDFINSKDISLTMYE